MIEIVEATDERLPMVRELFQEYARSLDFDLGFQDFETELALLPGDYSSPQGCLLLAFQDSEAAGCVALRPLAQDISEMKRLYVRSKFRGQGVGRKLTAALIAKASGIGYKRIRLDTVPSMKAAIEMYKSLGFHSIPPYRENPVPGTAYLEFVIP